jgi:hypothetical protein
MTHIGESPRVEGSFRLGGFRCWRSNWRIAAVLSLSLVGCGRIIAQKATEQLIAGDAVDRSIAQVDFRILTGKKIFLDTQYVNKAIPGVGFVTSEYIVSSLRQKMMCDGCLLEEKADEADFIVEMRIGALGADGHEIIFGMPPNNYLSLAASVAPTSPQAAAILPSMPELSVAKKDDQMAAAKIALFAYNRRTREPIWQSGISESRSVVADRWFFGAGPFHKGSIYSGKKQADPSIFSSDEGDAAKPDYFVERRFTDPTKSLADTPPAAKPAVTATPAASPPVVAAAPPATTTAAAATVTPAHATPVAAAAPPVAAAPAATAPAVAPAVATASVAPAAAIPATGATQTVNAAPAAVAAPPASVAPAPNPGPSVPVPSPATTTSAAGSANVPTNPPKTDHSVSALPSGQTNNVAAPQILSAGAP